jgi:threonylcarbamoyladenosine tRNA methylthiotransferase MtaB
VKIYLDTIGCRLNQAEIERYARQFRSAGHDLVASPAQADLAVVNTCAVTAAAASDSRQKIRQLARLGASELVVTGCWATLRPQEAAALPRVSKVIPNQDKDGLVFDVLQTSEDQFDLEPIDRQPIPGARLRTRVFIKVQDGCDNHCTFCVTRLARGAGRSRTVSEILADIRASIKSDGNTSDFFTGATQEIVLTGVHLGSWGSDYTHPLHLQELVKTILFETDIPRIRLSSLEPWDLNNEFFALWEDPRLCRHLHLPLQSGSAATLRRMARKTTPDSYAALVAAARKAIPGVAITTDIITGFPGETEFDHQESLEFVQSMQFADGHVFPYSPRPGTAAARFAPQIPEFIRKERSAQMREALAESAAYYQTGFIGEVLDVLWESAAGFGPQGWRLSGLTDNYLRVYAYALKQHWNQITPVYVTGVDGNALQGILHGRVG